MSAGFLWTELRAAENVAVETGIARLLHSIEEDLAMKTLRLPTELRVTMLAEAQAGYPNEVCGLLLGRQDADGVALHALHPVRNVHPDRTRDRFLVEAEDYLAAEQAATAGGWQIVGVWHSHPDHPPEPSATDREFAWPGWSYPIVSVNAGRVVELRSWRLEGDVFTEEEVLP
jgi:proteasome lid subunit RPN8/RPN11